MVEFNFTRIKDENDFIFKAILSVSTTFLCPLILVGNLLVIIPFVQSHRVRTPSNYLILYLAIMDLIFGIIMPLPCFIQSEEMFLKIFEGIQLSISIASFSFMVSIALDKAFSLAKPLRYSSVVTRMNIQIYSLAIGLLSIIISVSLTCFVPSNHKDFQILLLGVLLIPCVILASASYFYIYTVASRHIQAIRQMEVSVRSKERRDRLILKSTNNCYQSSIEPTTVFSSKNNERKKRIPHFKYKIPPTSRYGVNLSLTVALLLGSRLPCPLGTLILGNYTGLLIHVLDVPLYLCSALNPWVYAYHNLELKKVMRRYLRRVRKRICFCHSNKAASYPLHSSKTSRKPRFLLTTVVLEGSFITHYQTSNHPTVGCSHFPPPQPSPPPPTKPNHFKKQYSNFNKNIFNLASLYDLNTPNALGISV